MKTTYYKPNSEANGNGISVDSKWPREVRKLQSELALSEGYLPITDEGRVGTTDEFETFSYEIVEKKDGTNTIGYVRKWSSTIIPVKISMDKAIDYLIEKRKIVDVLRRITNDKALKNWWINDRKYVRNTAKSRKIAELLGMSVEELEEMAKNSMEK